MQLQCGKVDNVEKVGSRYFRDALDGKSSKVGRLGIMMHDAWCMSKSFSSLPKSLESTTQ